MADTNYIDTVTLLTADTMNDLNRLHYTILGDPASNETTVASATTPDIFAVGTGFVIDYTGTATCTGFAAAQQAGQKRTLICADACLFTAGANLIIEGTPTGNTITLAANAIVNVIAITTTQFKMTYSLSGTCTLTASGFTTAPTGTAKYSVINGIVSLYVPSFSATSNSTGFSLTGLPASISLSASTFLSAALGTDDGTETLISPYINSTSLYFSKGSTSTGANFTASGTKGVRGQFFSYLII